MRPTYLQPYRDLPRALRASSRTYLRAASRTAPYMSPAVPAGHTLALLPVLGKPYHGPSTVVRKGQRTAFESVETASVRPFQRVNDQSTEKDQYPVERVLLD